MSKATEVPRGECKLCWPCSKTHRSFLGIGEKPCACEGHVNGCPPNMIQR
ncbi:hypothetical protein [Streptomyces sp. cg35]